MARPITDAAKVVVATNMTVSTTPLITDPVSVAGYDWVEWWLHVEAGSASNSTLTVTWEADLGDGEWAPVLTETLTDGVFVQSPYTATIDLTGITQSSEAPFTRVLRVPPIGSRMRATYSLDEGFIGADSAASWIGVIRRVGG